MADQSTFIGQLYADQKPPTDRKPDIVIAIAMYVEEDSEGNPVNIAGHYWPLERVTDFSPPARNQHPSNFDIWATLHHVCDTIAKYDSETREQIRIMANKSKQMAFERKLNLAEDQQLADNVRKAHLASDIRDDILNNQAVKAADIRRKLRR